MAGMTVLLVGCGGAYLTAPSGSTLTLVANPTFIASNGGVSELSVIVTEPAGTDVADGTVVLWSTDLGHVDRETRTVRGIARNRLISDSRSGTARVVAQSGADALPPTPTTTPGSTTPGTTTPGPTTTTTRPASRSVSAAGAGTVALLLDGAQNSAAVEVTIGNARVKDVRLRAFPTRITNSNSTHVIATVTDASGNPVANVPVFFEVVRDRDVDFFESAGAPVFTDNNGEAEDVLRTRRTLPGLPIQVRAAAAGPGGFVLSPILEIPVR